MKRFHKFVRAAWSFTLLTICLVASAKADTLENLVFTGTATCTILPSCGGFSNGPITGTYTLDITTQTIVGPWSFSTPFGAISSGFVDSNAYVYDAPGLLTAPVFQNWIFPWPPFFYEFIQLDFAPSDTDEIGALSDSYTSTACYNLPAGVGGASACQGGYSVAGSTTLGNITPEPSSLTLVGLGLVTLVGLSLKKVAFD